MSAPTEVRVASDRIHGLVALGLAIVVMFFGVAGAWAALSPLDGAIVSEGIVKVEGNRKSVDQLEGGIVSRINVRDGDLVQVGDVLVELDRERLASQVDILRQQLTVAQATEARLSAELTGAQYITFPPELLRTDDSTARQALVSQRDEFEARRKALTGAESVLRIRIDNLWQQIEGKLSQEKLLNSQMDSLEAERESLKGLYTDGLTTRSRLLDLERSQTGILADIAEVQTSIASLKQSIVENEQQIEQLSNDRRAEVAGLLDQVRLTILDLGPSLANAQAALSRTVVRSPYAGRVVGLNVFSTGEVVPPGGTILEIVPIETRLIVEAKVRVEDIADLKIGAGAEIHFVSYAQLYVPMVEASVANVSADRLTDERTGAGYYLAQLVVDPTELAANPKIELYPGMPAQVMITTRRRSALEYLVGPLLASFDGALRQN
ncbi:MAG: HlyD family type I secretion periplasmic adaptor subunit [Rhizobiaceae bacterium]|nr:MAG: HlyD family type I secretion periplasmic adaptor subunit [Rhizobiaceae bacterium]